MLPTTSAIVTILSMSAFMSVSAVPRRRSPAPPAWPAGFPDHDFPVQSEADGFGGIIEAPCRFDNSAHYYNDRSGLCRLYEMVKPAGVPCPVSFTAIAAPGPDNRNDLENHQKLNGPRDAPGAKWCKANQ